MIWFTCKQCGKVHGRPENTVGTLVFCTCGQGNTVPWESTTAEPVEQTIPPPVELPKVPELSPLTFEPTVVGSPTGPSTYRIEEEEPVRRTRGDKRDPGYCFNHQHVPKEGACADCEEGFCRDCLVNFQGVPLCGPCKNFRIRAHEAPPATSTLATASVAIALLTGVPLAFCLLPWGQTVLSLLALLPQLVALGLGVRALQQSEKEGRYGSQAWAVTGVAAASLTCLLTLLVTFYASRSA